MVFPEDARNDGRLVDTHNNDIIVNDIVYF